MRGGRGGDGVGSLEVHPLKPNLVGVRTASELLSPACGPKTDLLQELYQYHNAAP